MKKLYKWPMNKWWLANIVVQLKYNQRYGQMFIKRSCLFAFILSQHYPWKTLNNGHFTLNNKWAANKSTLNINLCHSIRNIGSRIKHSCGKVLEMHCKGIIYLHFMCWLYSYWANQLNFLNKPRLLALFPSSAKLHGFHTKIIHTIFSKRPSVCVSSEIKYLNLILGSN